MTPPAGNVIFIKQIKRGEKMKYVKMVFKVGGSLAVGLPRKLLDEMGIKEKDLLLLKGDGNQINITNIDNILDNRGKVDKGGHNVIDR